MIHNEVEYILCAAIWFDDHQPHIARPSNIEYGVVFCGYRHVNIYAQLPWNTMKRIELGIDEIQQGFLTSTNRFVTREEASIIAKGSGQICDNCNSLCSEDIY
jgi:hypothetical protein